MNEQWAFLSKVWSDLANANEVWKLCGWIEKLLKGDLYNYTIQFESSPKVFLKKLR